MYSEDQRLMAETVRTAMLEAINRIIFLYATDLACAGLHPPEVTLSLFFPFAVRPRWEDMTDDERLRTMGIEPYAKDEGGWPL